MYVCFLAFVSVHLLLAGMGPVMVALPGHFRWLYKEHVFYLWCDMVVNQPHTVLDEDAVRHLYDTLQNKANIYYNMFNDSKLLAGCMFDLCSVI